MSQTPVQREVSGTPPDDLQQLVLKVEALISVQRQVLEAVEKLSKSLQSMTGLEAAAAGKAAPLPKGPERPQPQLAHPALRAADPSAAGAGREGKVAPWVKPGTGRARISWIIGPAENIGWAYGNNARRLSAHMPGFDHQIAVEDADIAVYFDVIVAERYPVRARHSIVRIGGPRPLERIYGSDPARMRAGLARFDAVIVLNLALYRMIAPLHPRVVLIPNALDLAEWHPTRARNRKSSDFTVGFAASANSTKEMEVKGVGVAEGATNIIGAKLLRLQRGDGTQLPHDRMVEDFYGRCHVLVHPVGAGREGSSNVIMEALACGVPVVTTVHAGLHSELLTERRNVLFRNPKVEEFADALQLLRTDRKLRDAIAVAGREFAERNHDIRHAAAAYARLIEEIQLGSRPVKPPSVSFVPFWTPAPQFASSRLRSQYPSEILLEHGWTDVTLGYKPGADVSIVTQCADNPLMATLKADQRPFVIYDVCDRYFENPRIFKRPDGEVNSLARFGELVERADILTVPTRELKAEIAQRFPLKPVIYLPETIDYGTAPQRITPETNRVVLWFGNPDRGNFESSKWMIERLMSKHGYTPLIVSRRSYFKRFPELYPHVVDWSLEAMENAFKEAGLCVVSHSAEEQSKSPNRLVTAIMHGVPTLVSGSRSCAEIMRGAQMDFAIVSTQPQLDRAMVKLHDPGRRRPFVRRLQQYISAHFGRPAIAEAYRSLLEGQTFPRGSGERLRVGFVSHNLVLGEGAPWSLFELAQGLQAAGHVTPFAYCPGAGPLESAYADGGVPIEIFDRSANHVVKGLNRRFGSLREHFKSWLASNRIDVIVCNTAKSGAFVHFAAEEGIPAMVIVRESFDPDKRFTDFDGEARFATEVGLGEAKEVVFVAKTSRDAWEDHKFFGRVSVIPNGVDPARFGATLTADKAQLRERLGLGKDEVVALCVGTINRRKGQEGIVNAFAAMPKELRDRTRIVFLGALDNTYLPEFEAMLKLLPQDVQERFLVVRATPDVGSYYRAADLLLMNSTSEAYPRSVVEGLLFGLPVLSTAVFGVQEQIAHGENGFLYPFDAMEAWTEHFTLLVSDEERRVRMSAEAARSFWKLTTHAEMLHSYHARLMQMMATKRARTAVAG